MKKLMIIALVIASTIVNAQGIKFPKEEKEVKDDEVKDKNVEINTEHTDTNVDADVFIPNIWLVRIEYVLQYEDAGVTKSLAKGENDYFGYANSYGIAGDKYIWIDTEQLKPWDNDPEYGMYQADTLTPVMTKVLVSKVGETDFQTVMEAEEGITLIDNNLAAYKLPVKNSTFKVKIDPSKNTPWLLLIGENNMQSDDQYYLAFVGISGTDSKSVDKVLKAQKEEGRVFQQGAIIYSTPDAQNFSLSDFVYISNNRSRLSKVKYKKELKVVKTEGISSKCSYCCDDIENITDKAEHKTIIKKWEELVDKAKNELKYEDDKDRSKALNEQIQECEAKIDEYKKGFLGINFLK